MRLISWDGPIIDPGSTNTQEVEEQGGYLENRTHCFHAVFDEPVPDEFIYSQQQCPQMYSFMVFKQGQVSRTCFVIGRSVRQIPDVPQAYIVEIRYANKLGNRATVQGSLILDPLRWPALITWGSYVDRETVERSLDEDEKRTIPVVTTSGEPLILEDTFHFRKITIQKNVLSVTKIFAEGEYLNIEDTKIGGYLFKQLTLWLLPIDIGPITMENRIIYYPITMTILHNPNTWVRRLRNQGYYMRSLNPVWDGNPTSQASLYYPLERIKDTDGNKVDRPVYLNKEGRPIQLIITGEIPNPQWNVNVPGIVPRTIKTYGVKAPDDPQVPFTPEELEESTLHHRTKKRINFTKELPLT